MNVSLTQELERFVSEQVEGGLYTSASEVVRHALRLLVEQEERKQVKLEALRQAIQEGMDSGDAVEWSYEEFVQRMKARRG